MSPDLNTRDWGWMAEPAAKGNPNQETGVCAFGECLDMPSRWNRPRIRWQRADHYLAVATIALIAFLLVTGTTAWLVGEHPPTADAAAVKAH
jgi:Mn2+/Fe2+ NRAMP family transporter